MWSPREYNSVANHLVNEAYDLIKTQIKSLTSTQGNVDGNNLKSSKELVIYFFFEVEKCKKLFALFLWPFTSVDILWRPLKKFHKIIGKNSNEIELHLEVNLCVPERDTIFPKSVFIPELLILRKGFSSPEKINSWGWNYPLWDGDEKSFRGYKSLSEDE